MIEQMENKFNGEIVLLLRACFHIEGDWRPFEDGTLWEMRGTTSPVENNKLIDDLLNYIVTVSNI